MFISQIDWVLSYKTAWKRCLCPKQMFSQLSHKTSQGAHLCPNIPNHHHSGANHCRRSLQGADWQFVIKCGWFYEPKISYLVSLVNMKFYELKRRKSSKDKENIGDTGPELQSFSEKTWSPKLKKPQSPSPSSSSRSPNCSILNSSSDSDIGRWPIPISSNFKLNFSVNNKYEVCVSY